MRTLSLSIDALTAGHAKQAAALRDLLNHPNRYHSWFTSRRAGKTTAAAYALILYALAKQRRNCLFIGLTKAHALSVILQEIVVPVLDRFGIPYDLNKSRQTITFRNGSIIAFTGSDDITHIQTFLGNRLNLVIIDEQQSQSPKVLQKLVVKILPPALSDSGDGRMLLCGTWPDVKGGYAYEQFMSGRFVTHNWAMNDNPHLVDPAAEQEEYLVRHGITRDDPEFRRDWFGEAVWSNAKTAYRYDDTKNAWTGPVASFTEGLELPPGHLVALRPPDLVNCYAIGIDPAYTSDRYCAVLWGWSTISPSGIWQCAEWTTDRGAHANKSQWLAALNVMVKNYCPTIRIISDSQATLDDVAMIEHGLVIEPAKKGKGSVKQRVDRLSDLLSTGRAHVIKGSVLENDLKLAQFDAEARKEGKYEWDNTVIHPDCADAATYAIPAYIEAMEPHRQKTALELQLESAARAWNPASNVTYGYEQNEYDSAYGGPRH